MKLQSKILLLISLFIFISCKEEDVNSDGTSENTNEQDSGIEKNKLYYPIEPGIEWCYNQDVNYCNRILEETRVYQDEIFYKGEQNIAETEYTGAFWARVDSDNRTSFLYDYPFPEGQVYILKEFIESDTIGTEFIAEYGSVDVDFKVVVTSTLLEKGAVRTVNGEEYEDLLKCNRVPVIINYTDGVAVDTTVSSDEIYYLAKGVGLVESTTTFRGTADVSNIHLLSVTGI